MEHHFTHKVYDKATFYPLKDFIVPYFEYPEAGYSNGEQKAILKLSVHVHSIRAECGFKML